MSAVALDPSVTEATFEARVLTRSREMPVLVDFWAAWCGPCRAIAPILERLGLEYAGRAEIVKVDTDAEAALAARYGIKSLPTLALFVDGKPVDAVIGAQPEAVLRTLIESRLDQPTDRERRAALAIAAAGDPEAAIAALTQLATAEPSRLAHRLALIDVLIAAGHLDAAAERLADVPAASDRERAIQERRARLELARIATSTPPADPIARRHRAAAREFLDGKHSEALGTWLELMRQQPSFGGGAVQRALRAAFELLGDEHALVPSSRRQMAALMH